MTISEIWLSLPFLGKIGLCVLAYFGAAYLIVEFIRMNRGGKL